MENKVYGTHELVEDVTRALITLTILVGGGYAIISGNPHAIEVTALMGVVVGYYFNPGARRQTPAPTNGATIK